ncbi:hypothetical protein Tco_1235058 [Tanacetum coccineum]
MIPQTTAISNIKLPILKKEEYDIWAMEMEHYLEYIDNDVGKERLKYFLLMAIPKEHMRRFHGMDDAKEIWEAIRTSKIYQGAPKTISVLPKLLLLFHKSKVSNNKVKSGFQESYSSFTPSILLQPMYPEKEVSCRQIAIDCYSNEEVRIRKQEGEFLVDGKTPVEKVQQKGDTYGKRIEILSINNRSWEAKKNSREIRWGLLTMVKGLSKFRRTY